MTKRNVVWLITKLIGVYFAYWTIVAVFVLIASIYTYISLPSPPRFARTDNANSAQPVSPSFPGNPANVINPANPAAPTTGASPAVAKPETPAEKAKNDALKQLLWDLLQTILYGLAAWYLIKDGRFLFGVLNREEPFDDSGKPVESGEFPLAKKKEEVVTTLNITGHPSRRSAEITSLNLSDTREETAASTGSAADAPIEILPATPGDEPAPEPGPAAPPAPQISPAPLDTTVIEAPRTDPQSFVPDALTSQPIASSDSPLDRPAGAPGVADDDLIEEFSINRSDERK